ncbi:MAG: 4Fe-4S binding protein [Promethearchaeota archaeon]
MGIQNLKDSTSEVDVYRQLQQTLDEMPIGFPPTESGVEIRLLKHLFTPDEAKIAAKLKFAWKPTESLEKIYERLKPMGYSKEELEKYLDNMLKKGAIFGRKEDSKKYYGLALLVVGIYEYQVNKLTKEFLETFQQYIQEAWGMEFMKTGIPQMRTIPIGLEIDHEIEIANYDNIKQLFENVEGPFVLINCICRQERELMGESCHATSRLEACMGFGVMAQTYIDLGWGREISRQEALETLKKNEEEGLIFQPGNAQKIDFVCSCCSCCCGGLTSLKQLPNPADFVTSNYYAEIDPDLCTGCKTCIERCQMDAISPINEISEVNRRRCIGCGNCVYVCPSDAIKLNKKDRHHVPPMTEIDLYNEIAQVKAKRIAKELRRQKRREIRK